jgi:diguanylate cyclase (GGDEF)-like protein/PAS domain S-box-containing protein
MKPSGSPPLNLLFYQVIESARDVVIITTADVDHLAIVYVNPAFTRLTGYSAAEVAGLSPSVLQGSGTSRGTLNTIRRGLERGQDVHEKVLNYTKSGAPYWLDVRIVPLRGESGRVTHFAAIERDVTLDKRRLDELENVADRDTLTGIPNWSALARAIEAEMLTRVELKLVGPCLAVVEVDQLNRVRLLHGRETADAVVTGVADRVAQNIRRGDMVGYISGGRFAVGMPSFSLSTAVMAMQCLRAAMTAEQFVTKTGPVAVSITVGVAETRQTDATVGPLLERANAALERAQRSGGDRVEATR